jgi:hypothetical protein
MLTPAGFLHQAVLVSGCSFARDPSAAYERLHELSQQPEYEEITYPADVLIAMKDHCLEHSLPLTIQMKESIS